MTAPILLTQKDKCYQSQHRIHDAKAVVGCRQGRHLAVWSRTDRSSWPLLPTHEFQAADWLFTPAADHSVNPGQRIAELSSREPCATKVDNRTSPFT